jgi:hypothetical protein
MLRNLALNLLYSFERLCMYGKRPGPSYSLKRCSKKHSVTPIHKHIPQVPTTKVFMPKSVKDSERKIFEVFRLRPAGQWSSDFLNSEAGRQLVESHWIQVQHVLMDAAKKSKLPMSKKEVEALLKKTMQLPEQKFLMLYEASLQGPLTHEAFREYMELFKKFWPKAYKGVFGYRTPGQITSACVKQEAKLK